MGRLTPLHGQSLQVINLMNGAKSNKNQICLSGTLQKSTDYKDQHLIASPLVLQARRQLAKR